MRVFCPGHVTGMFYADVSRPRPEEKGSVGVGFCTDLGATADVSTRPGTGRAIISINGKEDDAPVTRRAVEMLLPRESDASIEIELDAPVGQGLGMSAAGTLAACLALALELGIPDPKYSALRATHVAEVEMRTGLGDAVAQSIGGFVHRLEPGIPPHGELERLGSPETDIIICILGDGLSTSQVLGSVGARARIRDSGLRCLADFEADRSFENFTHLSWIFARDSGLATDRMHRALDAVEASGGQGSMVMLGNAVFAWGGDTDRLEKTLAEHGEVLRTRICQGGVAPL